LNLIVRLKPAVTGIGDGRIGRYCPARRNNGECPIATASVWLFGVAAALASAAPSFQSRSSLPSPMVKTTPHGKKQKNRK
jgi:hypothetical protein